MVDAALLLHQVDEVAHRRAVAPDQSALRQRHPLVGQRELGHAPAEVLLADEALGGDAGVGEEDPSSQASGVTALHLFDWPAIDCLCRSYVCEGCSICGAC